MTIIPYEPRQSKLADRAPALQVAQHVAEAVGDTDFVPTGLRGNFGAIAAAILYGDEVGVGPMQSLAKIAVINGRPTLAAETQRGLILAAGHELWVEESTTTKCTIAGRRRDSDATSRVTWTMDDAKRANLAGKPPYRLYPRQMLLARASAELARAIFPDVIGGMAATEEMEDEAGAGPPNGIPPAPEPAKRTRRRRSVTATEPKPEQQQPEEPQPEPEPPGPIDEGTRNRLMMLYREAGFETSQQRHSFASSMLGRRIESSIDLTPDEAAKLIGILENAARTPQPDDD